MLKKIVVILALVVCCYCEENNEIVAEETRAKKKKRGIRLLVMIALFVLSKLAVIKLASFFFFIAFFQKLFSLGGVLLTYFMRAQLGANMPPSAAPSVAPANTYGPPEYNTLGYSYGPPDDVSFNSEGPSLADFKGPINWLLHRP